MTLMLSLVVRLMPREWGRAMQAELAALDDPQARRRFALGCMRAVLSHSTLWLRVGAIALVAAVPALLFTGPGGTGEVSGLCIVGLALAIGFGAVAHVRALPIVARTTAAGALVWWLALLASSGARAHPHWALAVIVVCAVAAARAGGEHAALGTAFATCLAVFVVAAGTYAALPRLAPDVVPSNAENPRLENQIESTDPYIGELLLSALVGVALIAAARRSDVAL